MTSMTSGKIWACLLSVPEAFLSGSGHQLLEKDLTLGYHMFMYRLRIVCVAHGHARKAQN